MTMKNLDSIIVSTPGILGGKPRLEGTRLAVETIAGWYKKGYSPEEIAEQYSHLALFQIYAALAYYHANQSAIEASLLAEESSYDSLMQEHSSLKKRAA
jgi:uncharacterized protein (DUF433 family)